jgi:hypothetical protein
VHGARDSPFCFFSFCSGLLLSVSLSPHPKKKLGVAKRAHLFFFDAALAADYKLCLGFVGSGGLRFCLKPVVTKDQKG